MVRDIHLFILYVYVSFKPLSSITLCVLFWVSITIHSDLSSLKIWFLLSQCSYAIQVSLTISFTLYFCTYILYRIVWSVYHTIHSDLSSLKIWFLISQCSYALQVSLTFSFTLYFCTYILYRIFLKRLPFTSSIQWLAFFA